MKTEIRQFMDQDYLLLVPETKTERDQLRRLGNMNSFISVSLRWQPDQPDPIYLRIALPLKAGEETKRSAAARSLADLVSAKQLGMIRALARELGVDAETESLSLLECRTDELSKRAASTLIQCLQDQQKEREGGY